MFLKTLDIVLPPQHNNTDNNKSKVVCEAPTWYEPAQDKTYDKTCVTNKDLDQPVNPPSMAKIFVDASLDRLEVVEDTFHHENMPV